MLFVMLTWSRRTQQVKAYQLQCSNLRREIVALKNEIAALQGKVGSMTIASAGSTGSAGSAGGKPSKSDLTDQERYIKDRGREFTVMSRPWVADESLRTWADRTSVAELGDDLAAANRIIQEHSALSKYEVVEWEIAYINKAFPENWLSYAKTSVARDLVRRFPQFLFRIDHDLHCIVVQRRCAGAAPEQRQQGEARLREGVRKGGPPDRH